MIEIAHERLRETDLGAQVRLIHGDCLQMEGDAIYDAIHSREVFLHIHDKRRLFDTVRRLLKSGGRFEFTDYCCGDDPPTADLRRYIEERAYSLRTVEQYHTLLTGAGFVDVIAEDMTRRFIDILQKELDTLPKAELSAETNEQMAEGWRNKIRRSQTGEQRWGWFFACKPAEW